MDEESFLDRIDRLLSPETPEEIARDFAMGAHPVTGTAMDAGNFLMGIRNRDVPRAGISALAALLPFIGAGTLRRVGEGVAKKLKKPNRIKSIESENYYDPASRTPDELKLAEELGFYRPGMADTFTGEREHFVRYLDPRHGEAEFSFSTFPSEYVDVTKPGSNQLEMFPEVGLEVTIPTGQFYPKNLLGSKWDRASVGASGIRSLGRAAIEDYEKGIGGLHRVSKLYGPRVTGAINRNRGTHYTVLPRSFFFK